MDVNFSLIGQMITFSVFIWFTMKYVWPPINRALEERQKTIADGLAAGEKGVRDLEAAQSKVDDMFKEARLESEKLIEQANTRSLRLIDDAKQAAHQEGQRIIDAAKAEMEQEFRRVKQELQQSTAELAITMATKVVQQEMSAEAQEKLIQQLIKEV